MTSLLFESFVGLVIVGLIISGIFYYLASERRTAFWRRGFKVVAAIFVALLAINFLVVTDREAIRSRLDSLVSACRRGDVDGIGVLLTDDFQATGMSKSELLGELRGIFPRFRITSVRLLDVKISPPAAQVLVVAQVHSQSASVTDWIHSEWHLVFKREKDQWQVDEIRPVSFYRRNVNDIREVLRESNRAP